MEEEGGEGNRRSLREGGERRRRRRRRHNARFAGKPDLPPLANFLVLENFTSHDKK